MSQMPTQMPPGLAQLLSGSAGPAQAQDPGSSEEPGRIIAQMIADAHRYIALEPDAIERSKIGAILQSLLQVQADEQKESQQALGGKVSPRMMQRAYQNG